MMPPGGRRRARRPVRGARAHPSTRALTDPELGAPARRARAVGGRRGPGLRRRAARPLRRGATTRRRSASRPSSRPRCRGAAALGQQAWQEAREANDFGRFRAALERLLELRHRYIACFDAASRAPLRRRCSTTSSPASPPPSCGRCSRSCATSSSRSSPPPATPAARDDGALPGHFPRRGPADAVARRAARGGRLRPRALAPRPAVHPFAAQHGARPTCGSPRATTRRPRDGALLLPARVRPRALRGADVDPRLYRTTLATPSALGVHESQSRLWENLVGRSRPFCEWVLPLLRRAPRRRRSRRSTPTGALPRRQQVQPSLIRIEADETTYNLHIALRFELELALIEGRARRSTTCRTPGTRRRTGCSASRSRASPRASCRTSTGAPG